MLQVTLGSLRSSSRRYVATALAIVLGVGFLAVTLVLSDTLSTSIEARVAGDVGRYAVVVGAGEQEDAQSVPAAALAAVSGLPGVAAAQGSARTFALVKGTAQASSTALTWNDLDPGSPLRLTAGTGPRSGAEAVVSTSVATRADLRVGSTVVVGDTQGKDHPLTVSGIVDPGAGLRFGTSLVLVTAPTIAAWSGSTGLDEIDVLATAGTDVGALRDRVAAAVAGVGPQQLSDGTTLGAPVTRTGAEETRRVVDANLSASDRTEITTFLLGFAAVAIFVSAIVIANTFAILVAQRLQQLALVRCVGATRRQVFGSVLAESVVVGLLGSALGLAGGIGAAALVSTVATKLDSPIPLQSLGISATSVIVPLLAGTIVTVGAALFPAVRATRVAPLAALRPEVPASVRTRAGIARLVVAGLLVAVGGAALAVGTSGHTLLVALGGGMLSFVGVLVGAVALVPALVRVVGAVPRRFAGVPGDLAVENAVRNRSRAAATSSALLVGVTLITTMSVGAASAQAAISDHLAASYAVDAQVVSQTDSGMTPALVSSITATEGIAATVPVTSGDALLRPAGRPSAGTEEPDRVIGVPTTTVGTVLRSAELSPLARVRPGVVVVTEVVAEGRGLADGGRAMLGTLPVTVAVVTEAPWPVMAADGDLARAGVPTVTRGVLVRLDDAQEPGPALDRLASTVADDDVFVDGAAPQRAELESVLSVVLLVVTGLLAVAILIALVGVGNTLALSVLERGRESALVRALGLTRGQLRGSLAIEAALLAVVGAVLGLALGVLYGWTGVSALLGDRAPVPLVVPWARVVVTILAALVAGVAAAWLPSRRAARITPAAALAME